MLGPVLLFFDISAGELIVILLVAFIVFGPSKIPEIARKIGRGVNEVRRASDEIKREINKEARKMESSVSMDDFDLNNTRQPLKKTDNATPGEKGTNAGPSAPDNNNTDIPVG
jgi:TatA/E family protein of Tat protein translocase